MAGGDKPVLSKDTEEALDEYKVDLLCGGFPCQPFSVAGKRKGTSDKRWLWPEFIRVIRLLRPNYILVENVPGILASWEGMGEILRGLAQSGYDAEWDSIPAAAFGAPHRRYRVFIVAYASGKRCWPKTEESIFAGGATPQLCSWWSVEPDVGRVAYGVPRQLDRGRSIGNAVVPQVAEWIGRRIMEFDK